MSHRVDTIVTALRQLGGQARPAQIAREIRRIFPGPHPPTLLNSVRGRLQECSSDSRLFRGRRDLFYSVHGIGGGVWGLRETNISAAADTEAETQESDLGDVVARLEDGAQPTYGSPGELQGRQELLADIGQLKEELVRPHPRHGRIGHNQPPLDQREGTIDAEILGVGGQEAATIESELMKELPDSLVVARSAKRLQRFTHWLAGKGDAFAEEFARSFGKSLGKSAGIAIATAGLILALSHVIQSAAHWLQLVLPAF